MLAIGVMGRRENRNAAVRPDIRWGLHEGFTWAWLGVRTVGPDGRSQMVWPRGRGEFWT